MGDLPYFALFYVIGIVVFGLFVRFWLSKKRLLDEEKKLRKKRQARTANEATVKKIPQHTRGDR